MSLFDWLLIGHLVGDYLFQTGWMAAKKMKCWHALIIHAAVYTVVIYLFGLFSTGLSFIAIALIFISHVILDQGWLVRTWTKYIQTPPQSEVKWLTIMADQSFHLIMLALAVWMSHG